MHAVRKELKSILGKGSRPKKENMTHQLTSKAENHQAARKAISDQVKRTVLQKANHSCEFSSSGGKKCGSTYQLQVDHQTTIAWGGTNQSANLRILCRSHNLFMAAQMRLM